MDKDATASVPAAYLYGFERKFEGLAAKILNDTF